MNKRTSKRLYPPRIFRPSYGPDHVIMMALVEPKLDQEVSIWVESGKALLGQIPLPNFNNQGGTDFAPSPRIFRTSNGPDHVIMMALVEPKLDQEVSIWVESGKALLGARIEDEV